MASIAIQTKQATLRQTLIEQGKTRWLDIGCGGNFERGFHCVDVFPLSLIRPRHYNRYYRIDVLNCPDSELDRLGSFDLVRMQHVMEHFSIEEGTKVLNQVAKILRPGGVLLISVPDLRVHIEKYLRGDYQDWKGFKNWANKRIPENAPDSYYFSIYTHSMPFESHKWSFDYDGLHFLVDSIGEYENMRELKATDSLASTPFTHNRPEEDVCIMAYRK